MTKSAVSWKDGVSLSDSLPDAEVVSLPWCSLDLISVSQLESKVLGIVM
jgi:hypothetical protein